MRKKKKIVNSNSRGKRKKHKQNINLYNKKGHSRHGRSLREKTRTK